MPTKQDSPSPLSNEELRAIGIDPNGAKETILVTGASGLIGSALVPFLISMGHTVKTLSRGLGDLTWDPEGGRVSLPEGSKFDVVVHLAGENIAKGRWSSKRKEAISKSRQRGTHVIATYLSTLKYKPKVFLSASATGFYGETGETLVSEDSPAGSGFLPDVCAAWERASAPLLDNQETRVCALRFGVVLSPRGGALAKMLPLFRLGLGGPLGDGQQWMSWIGIDDAIYALYKVMMDSTLKGGVNVVSPTPIRNYDFTKTLGAKIRRPTFLRVPSWALNLALGEMAQDLLLSSSRVAPTRLIKSGFRWKCATFDEAVQSIL